MQTHSINTSLYHIIPFTFTWTQSLCTTTITIWNTALDSLHHHTQHTPHRCFILKKNLLSSFLSLTFVSAWPRIPWGGPEQWQATETKIPVYSKEATALQESETAIYFETKFILLTPWPPKNWHFALCEYVAIFTVVISKWYLLVYVFTLVCFNLLSHRSCILCSLLLRDWLCK